MVAALFSHSGGGGNICEKCLKLARWHPKTHPELAVLQFLLFYEEVKLSPSICTLDQGMYPEPWECPVKTL